jgi:hypothetical protein
MSPFAFGRTRLGSDFLIGADWPPPPQGEQDLLMRRAQNSLIRRAQNSLIRRAQDLLIRRAQNSLIRRAQDLLISIPSRGCAIKRIYAQIY